MPVRSPRWVGSAYQWLAWWLQRLLIITIWPPMGGGSEGRALVIGACRMRVPGGRGSLMVLTIANHSCLVCLVSWRQR
jgi:hypothetical protein